MAMTQDTVDLGTGLKLVDGDLVLVADDSQPAQRGFDTISGRPNFAQALQVIIGTPFGSDPVNVNYGLDVAAIFTTAGTVASIEDVISLNIVKSLAGDDRVQQVDNVLFDDSPGFAELAPELVDSQYRQRRVWHAVASVQLVSGTQQVVVSGAMP